MVNFAKNDRLEVLIVLARDLKRFKKDWVLNQSKENGSKELWSKNIFLHKKYAPPPKKNGPKSMVKIRPVTSEILFVWTNVTMAYVARTNVTTTVGIF